MTERSGGQILVDQLLAQGVERLACVPGESYLAVLDALHDAKIDVLVCRNEGGAAMMAEAYGKLTGRPGICFVTRGPGATNASHGIHIAAQDSTPMILFIGQVERAMREREAFQEVDYKAFFGSMAKWVVEVESAARLPELVARAFRVACQGRPGPVVIALPEDVLTEMANVPDAPKVVPAESAPTPQDMNRFADLLRQAKKPLFILGGSRWSPEAQKSLIGFAEKFGVGITTSFRRAHLFPSDHPNYVGDVGIGPNPKLAARVKEADLLVLIGARMSEMPSSSYSLIDIPNPRQTLVHIHPGAEELGRVYQPALAIQASPNAFCASLADLAQPNDRPWTDATRVARQDFLDWTDTPVKLPGKFQYGEAMKWLRERLPADAIITNGAGNYAIWIHRYYRFRQFGTQLAPTSGSMGYGVPAAVMAKRQRPDSPVVCFAGDGCFMMNGQEFATAVQYGIPLIVVVLDNSMYGTIRMHQEREYPGRVSATLLKNPNFADYAKAFGGHGERVEKTEDFAPAFERAVQSGKPAIIHCIVDPEAITPARTLSQIRDDAVKAGK
ncbi:thiamine pyrophosphate-binding protein [Taklimakanibacter albus]|uniref:Thiamine pyrophosphate-binding protein n=1 Tax=Taklimakanibacter albus TaxID=2800327 RepID=A0ACC5QY13_9HYPH|nr:thiamine pyrophosphate-binding protein [Aestuariivirga sp. YIM B02566]MBK1865280.1 thiamine pyrophosphate-binding protein [Aestuariivirga sp. YIM B02566]